MRKVVDLKELCNCPDCEWEYGLKAAGIARVRPIACSVSIDSFPVVIPEGFAVPVSVSIEHPEVRSAYLRLTRTLRRPRIILARSSDPEEEPGKFESLPSLYDPAAPEESFGRWLAAARKVRASGARGQIGQLMAGELIDFKHDYQKDAQSRRIPVCLKSFGGNLTGFVGNSTGIVMGDEPVVVVCLGLPSKIVRGDLDVCMLYKEGTLERAVHLQQAYWANQYSDLEQKTVDVVALERPERIATIGYRWHAPLYTHGPMALPFYLPNPTEGCPRLNFKPFQLLEIIDQLRKSATPERHVELEGSVGPAALYLFQYREYELPEKKHQELMKIPEDRLIYKAASSFGFNRFQGDLFVSRYLIDIPENAIFLYIGDTCCVDLDRFFKYRQMVFGAYRSEDVFAGMHTLGQSVQTIVKLGKKGVQAVAVGGSYDKLMVDVSKYSPSRVLVLSDSVAVYKDVTVECDGTVAQIYFNQ